MRFDAQSVKLELDSIRKKIAKAETDLINTSYNAAIDRVLDYIDLLLIDSRKHSDVREINLVLIPALEQMKRDLPLLKLG